VKEVAPIKCPKCGKQIKVVYIDRGQVIEWNEEEKRYEDNGQATGTARCGHCNTPIGGYGQENWGLWPEFDD